jgi:vacuolar-type H+-ATPase subunit I/STV1
MTDYGPIFIQEPDFQDDDDTQPFEVVTSEYEPVTIFAPQTIDDLLTQNFRLQRENAELRAEVERLTAERNSLNETALDAFFQARASGETVVELRERLHEANNQLQAFMLEAEEPPMCLAPARLVHDSSVTTYILNEDDQELMRGKGYRLTWQTGNTMLWSRPSADGQGC